MHVYFLEQKGPAELDGINNVLDFKFLLSKSKGPSSPPGSSPGGVHQLHPLPRSNTFAVKLKIFGQLVKGSRNAQLLAVYISM